MSGFINFQPQQFNFSDPRYLGVTNAIPEGGQDVAVTQAFPENGGFHLTTFAEGEEGGGGITTFALGEEGGFTAPGPGESGGINDRTQDYFDFFNRADGGFGFFGGGQRDGVLTRGEITSQTDLLNQQSDYIGFLQDFYGQYNPFFSQYLGQIKDRIDTLATVGGRLNSFFQRFASQSGNGTAISRSDILDVARTDGNIRNVSNFDLGIVFFAPQAESGQSGGGGFLDLFRNFLGG